MFYTTFTIHCALIAASLEMQTKLFVGPFTWLARSLKGRSLCLHATQSASKFFRELLRQCRVVGGEIMLFGNVVADIVEFLLSRRVVVYKFPVATTDGATQVDARSYTSPYIRKVPYDASPVSYTHLTLPTILLV